MIVRILHEGQFRVSGAELDRLNEIDEKLVAAVAARDQTAFTTLLKQLIHGVREHGKAVPVDEFVESDVILPGEDATMDEVEDLFTGEGALPG
jgi:PspA-Associated protein